MSSESFKDREAGLIRLLTETAAARARTEAELAARLAEESAATDAEHRRLVSDAAHGFGEEFRGLEAQQQRELAAFDADAAQKAAALAAEHEARERALEAKAVALKKRTEREHQDAKWLAETMIEPGEIKLKEAAETWERTVETMRKEAAALYESYAAAYAVRSREPLAISAVPVEVIAAGPQAAHEIAAASLKNLTEGLPGFRNAADPLTGQPGVCAVAGLIAALAAAGGAIAGGLGTGIAAGAGVGAAGLAVVVCQVIAKIKRRDLPTRLAAAREDFGRIETLRPVILERAQLERSEGSVWLRKRRDDEIAKANEAYRIGMRTVEKMQKIELVELRAANAAKREQDAAASAAARQKLATEWKNRIREITGGRDEVVTEADNRRDARRKAMEDDRQRTIASEKARWDEQLGRAWAALEAIRADAADSSREDEERLKTGGAAPRGVRFGTLRVDVTAMPGGKPDGKNFVLPGVSELEIPVMLDLAGTGGLLVFAGDKAAESGDARLRVLELVRSLMARVLLTLPPGKARFTIFDPIGLGQNFAGFMHLADTDPLLVSGRIWTETKDIEQRLADLTEHMETVIQKYLRDEFPAIQDYNIAAGEVAEPYRFLILADFPTNISEQAAKRLASIVNSGARCGVFTIIAAGARDRVALKGPLADLEKACFTLTRRGEGFAADTDPFKLWPLEVDPPMSEAELTGVIKTVGERAKDSSRVRVPFTMINPEPGREWSLSSAQDLSIPLGRAGAKRIQNLVFGRGTAQHGLIAGRTGSGKSTLLHVIVTNAALWFGPDQLELYLIDFKKGVEFKAYANAALPHARVIAIESEREFGLSVLKRLDEELSRRGELLRNAGVQDLAAYRRANGEQSLPRVLLVIDEFQELFTQDDRIASDAALLLDRLVRQGRAFGVHVLLGSQTLGGAFSIARSTIGQMAVRIALQCSEADSYLILSEDNAAARLLTRPGEAIYNDASGMSEGNSPFQIAWLEDEERAAKLGMVTAEARRRGAKTARCVVFEGNQPADVRSNVALVGSGEGSREATRDSGLPIWLGEPLAIKPPAGITLRRESGANLLMIGNDADAMAGMIGAALMSAGSWSVAGTERPLVRLVMAGAPDEVAVELLPEIARRIDAEVKLYTTREAASAVKETAAMLDEGERELAARPVLLVIWGMQRCRDLRRADDFDFSSSGDGEESPSKALGRVLVEGPPQGVHTIAWCDTLTNAERTLDRAAIREFGARVATQMSASDSTTLIDSPAASELGRFRALLNVVDAGLTEKFRPYRPVDRAWLAATFGTQPEADPRDPIASGQ